MTGSTAPGPGRRLETDARRLPQETPELRQLVAEINVLINSTGRTLDLITKESGLPGGNKRLSEVLRRPKGPDWHIVESIVRACARLRQEPEDTYLPKFRQFWLQAHPEEPSSDLLSPVVTPRRRFPAWTVVIAGITAVVVLAGLVIWLVKAVIGKDVVCDDDGECTGVTADNGAAIVPGNELWKLVAEKIAAENKRVEAVRKASDDTRVVTVAYLVSLPQGEDSAKGIFALRHELEGAYIAQWRANNDTGLGPSPLVRLLIANNGHEGRRWEPVLDQLLTAADDADYPLTAVVGLGLSRNSTLQTIDRLNSRGIPMVSTVLSADKLDLPGKTLNAVVRAGPTNSGEATAIFGYLAQKKIVNPLLIEDLNPRDQYVTTLAAAFRQRYRSLRDDAERYDASLPDAPNVFNNMMGNVCQRNPDIVYFAGRSTDLANFIAALATRPCLKTPIEIITGDSATSLANRLNDDKPDSVAFVAGLKSNVKLRYAAMAHPSAWTANRDAFSEKSTRYFTDTDCEACYSRLFPSDTTDNSLADGLAIMGHDALLIVIRATRAITWHDTSHNRGAIIQQWNRLNGLDAVPGASGYISLNKGNPDAKAVPILELRADGVRFVTLTSTAAPKPPFTPPTS